MPRSVATVLLLILLLSACRSVPRAPLEPEPDAVAPKTELRGVWITRFEWATPNADTMRVRIVRALDEAAQTGFNAVFFQVRGAAETLYPSPVEVWSNLLNGRDPGFDPVAFAVTEAHQRGLAFHAYINLLPLWNGENPPSNPDHLWFRRGPTVSPDSSWVCFGPDGQPMQRNEYYYLNPALPEVKTYLKQVLKHFTETYDVDGIHFDRIRYAGPRYVYDPYTSIQFKADSLRSPLTRAEWARRALTDLVEDVVAEILLIKPYLQISAATWGLYRTDDLPGYERFGSGYGTYFQDAIDWLDRGILDFIVPMIYWDLADPRPNLDEVWADFRRRTPAWPSILPGLIVKEEWTQSGEMLRQIRHVRDTGAHGHVLFSLSGLRPSGGFEALRSSAYAEPISGLPRLKRTDRRRVAMFQVDGLAVDPGDPVSVSTDPVAQRTDAEGWLGLILPGPVRSLDLTTPGGTTRIDVSGLQLPYRYRVNPGGTAERIWPWVEFRRLPSDTTYGGRFHVLARTEWPAESSVNARSTRTYRTGIFFDEVAFREGPNRIRIAAEREDGSRAVYEREVVYVPRVTIREPFPLWVDHRSITPAEHFEGLPDDRIRVSAVGSKGQNGWVVVPGTSVRLPLRRTDRTDSSFYEGDLPLDRLEVGRTYPVAVILEAAPAAGVKPLETRFPASVTVKRPSDTPLVRVKNPQSILTYNLGPIRLGGPIIAEYEPGVLLQVDGRAGEALRVRLNRTQSGFIHQNDVEEAPAGTPAPQFFIQSASAGPENRADVVRIPYPEPVPYAVFPEPELGRIRIALYGVKTSSTWITHRQGLQVVERVDWQQSAADTYEVLVYLKTPDIWGYTFEQGRSSLALRVKHPPVFAGDADRPLAGLKVAIEAGHGGSNVGATGLSGMPEKDLNLAVALEVERICRERGMEVLQVRPDDRDMALEAKRRAIEESDADLAVSIHANSASTERGYLGASGTSTYYHNPFWAPFARDVYDALLELPLGEFGVVGSFNYRVTRMSSRPAILVEQAFMSHAEDEEKLASPEFRTAMAEKVVEGMERYVRRLRR